MISKVSSNLNHSMVLCIGILWQGFWKQGGYRGVFCEKVLEASPVSDSTLEHGKGVESSPWGGRSSRDE